MDGLIVAGKYHVIQSVGQGGMGVVYDAVHSKTGRRVALKLIHEASIASGGPAARRRFEREARAAAAIESLHVVQVLDSGEDETSGLPFIVMEFLQGTDLRTLLQKGPLEPELAVTIALQICLGLQKAHENDIIHRDLKPANIFLSEADGGRQIVKLLDFGIAKLTAETETVDLTGTGDMLGSPPYMSPEQLRSPRDVDRRTDVWSLGVVLYEMLTGNIPTHGISPIGARVYAICHTPSPRLPESVPPALADVVHRALEIEQDKRFASIEEMAAALQSQPALATAKPKSSRRLFFYGAGGTLAALISITLLRGHPTPPPMPVPPTPVTATVTAAPEPEPEPPPPAASPSTSAAPPSTHAKKTAPKPRPTAPVPKASVSADSRATFP